MNQRFYFVNFVGAIGFYLMSALLVYSTEESHFLQVKISEFQFEDGATSLQSGAQGNIYVWDPSFANPEEREEVKPASSKNQLFHMQLTHKHLFTQEQKIRNSRKTADNNNIVTAALTLFFQKGEKNYAITHTFSLGKDTLAFVSGTKGKSEKELIDAEKYSPSDLLKHAYRRSQRGLFPQKQRLQYIIEQIQKVQEEKITLALNFLIREKDHIGDLLSMENILHNFDSLVPFGKEHRKIASYGPVTDSEQLLLYYLEQELIISSKLTSTAQWRGVYMDMLTQYEREQYSFLQKRYRVDYNCEGEKSVAQNRIATLTNAFNYAVEVPHYLPIGAMLHLHSTRELCEFCATSLVHEFYYENDEQKPNFANRLRQYMGQVLEDVVDENPHLKDYSPFFVVSASYNAGDAVSEIGHELRPLGTISGKLTRPPQDGELTEDGLLNLNQIIENKTLPLLPLG